MKLTSFLPPHPPVSPSSLASLFLFPPLAFIFPFFSSPSFLLYVCLLKPKWLSFQRLRVCAARCCLDISISRGGGLCWGFVSAPASQGTLFLVLPLMHNKATHVSDPSQLLRLLVPINPSLPYIQICFDFFMQTCLWMCWHLFQRTEIKLFIKQSN